MKRYIRATKVSADNKFAKDRIMQWPSLKVRLSSDLREGEDPLYEMTEAGRQLTAICETVEQSLGYEVSPSVQNGVGAVCIYSVNNGSCVATCDYKDFNRSIVDLAISCWTKRQFIDEYQKYFCKLVGESTPKGTNWPGYFYALTEAINIVQPEFPELVISAYEKDQDGEACVMIDDSNYREINIMHRWPKGSSVDELVVKVRKMAKSALKDLYDIRRKEQAYDGQKKEKSLND